MKQKIEWISVLQGWSMLLVVIGHITLSNTFHDPNYPIASCIEGAIYTFHMPLFMFISGMLFYYTKISRDKSFPIVIRDKVKRLGIPFLFFTFSTLLLKYMFNPFMRRPVELSWEQVINCFIYPESNPLGEMWFVATLFILFLFYPIYRISLKRNMLILLVAVGAIFLNIFRLQTPLFCLSNVSYMLVFFYAGILFFKYELYRLFQNKVLFSVLLIAFMLVNAWPVFALIKAFVGILFSLALCLQLAFYFPRLFSSFREYTFQIFLTGIFFQIAVRFLYLRLNNEWYFSPLYITSILVGLYLPIAISKIVERLHWNWLLLCFGLPEKRN